MHPRYSVILLAAMAAAAPQTAPLTLSGLVLNSQTAEPIAHALIQIVHHDVSQQQGRRAEPSRAATFSDGTGSFHFDGLAAGFYDISAAKPQFRGVIDSSSLELTASKTDVQLKLSPFSVITGKVTDQDGQPLRGVNVAAISMQFPNGWRQGVVSRTAYTDDRGIFRLWNLHPAKYYLKAAGRSGGTYSVVVDSEPAASSEESFVPVYFGGGHTLDAAAALELQPGVATPANFSVQLVPGYRIRGTLQNMASRRAVRFELLIGDESTTPRAIVNYDNGRFEIEDVAAGSYRLRAIQDTLSAEVSLNVGRTEVSGVALRLVPAVDIRELIRYSNSPAEVPDDVGAAGDREPEAMCGADLRSTAVLMGPTYSRVKSKPGEFMLKQVLPGIYRVSVQCFGGYANSVTFGDQDLLANPLVEIRAGAVPPPIETTAAYGGGSIRGTVSVPGYQDNTLLVIVVPQSTASIGPIPVFAVRRNGQAGPWEFRAANLAPGSYTVYCFPMSPQIEFRNPEFLRTLRGGTSVQVADRSEAQVAITEMAR